MPTYLTPGIYLEEVGYAKGPKPLLQLPPEAEETDNDRPPRRWTAEHTHTAFIGLADRGPFDEPVWLHSWSDFGVTFGNGIEGGALALAVYGFFANGGQSCVVVRTAPDYDLAIAQLDTVEDISLVCAPDLMMPGTDAEETEDVQRKLIDHCHRHGDRMAILDCPPGLDAHEIRNWRIHAAGYDSAQAVLYYPWIKVYDWLTADNRLVPPCGHIAGVYARTDLLRGFHHTPANQQIKESIRVETLLNRHEQDLLNPIGINALVESPGRGTMIWGGRTLSTDPDWRYISRRRTFNFIFRSIRKGTNWAIFERPDDRTLRPRIAADIRDFLNLLWRSGALWGDTPEDAFSINYNAGPFDDPRVVHVECAVRLEHDYTNQFRLAYFCD
ncbi:phage tail sheath subtilisin-like domain-containing protein [Lentzea alba]|uniref:phage tail sheath family protein n=1 Tax=Lentzea alba TaxID=2714351 RepID=UPI0039BEDFE8